MRRWIEQSPVTIGVVLGALGFLTMFLAWNGAAERDYVAGQIPYLISGGLIGLGLLGTGLCVVVVQSNRRDSRELAARIEALVKAIDDRATDQPGPTRATVAPVRKRTTRKSA